VLPILSLVESYQILVSLVLFLVSAISAFYYLRLLKLIFFEKRQRIVDYSQVRVPDRVFGMECFVVSFLSFSLFFCF